MNNKFVKQFVEELKWKVPEINAENIILEYQERFGGILPLDLMYDIEEYLEDRGAVILATY